MGCWGITAFESDTGLDAIGLIRNHLPEQGDVKLQQMIDWLRADSWNAPPEVSEGVSHTSPMAVAELIVKFQEKDLPVFFYSIKRIPSVGKGISVGNSFLQP